MFPARKIASNNRSGRSSDSRTTGVDMAITFNHSRQGSPQQLKSLRLGRLVKIARKVSGRVILERLLAPFTHLPTPVTGFHKASGGFPNGARGKECGRCLKAIGGGVHTTEQGVGLPDEAVQCG
jgi:hypothetical protein